MSALHAGLALVRRQPVLVLAVLVAVVAPTLLGGLPIAEALRGVLDVRPAARQLVEAPMDDSLVAELIGTTPGLVGVTASGALIALLLGVPALWLTSAWIAARALDASLPARLVAARGLSVMLAVAPLRLVPIGLAAAIAVPADAPTLSGLAPRLIVAAVLYALGAAKVTTFADLARGFALVAPERPLRAVLGDALATAWRAPGLFLSLVAGELTLALAGVGALLVTRPLGVYTGLVHLLGLCALVLRAAGIVVLVGAAATGARSRSA